jgi:purine-binding chemotaxis protein CheW
MDMIREGGHLARDERARSAAPATTGDEYLTFRLGAEEYCVEILKVQEIRSYAPPTRIANAPGCHKGVIDLRGVIVPIIDLRLVLGCDEAAYDALTVVVVLNVRGRVVGAVVDSVSDVQKLGTDALRPAPALSSAPEASFIKGIATVQQRMLIVMDIEALMSRPSMRLVDADVAP